MTVEREIGAGVVASATYLMNIDRQLPNSVDINIAPSTATKMFQLQGGTGAVGVRDGETFVVPVYTQRVNTSFGPVTDIVSNADATYNAMVLEARRRLRRGFEFRTSWTWAKAIDYGQGGATPRTNAQFDPFNVLYDKGLSALNYPAQNIGQCGVGADACQRPALASDRRERMDRCAALYRVERQAIQPGHLRRHAARLVDTRASTAPAARCICRRWGGILCGCRIPDGSICASAGRCM